MKASKPATSSPGSTVGEAVTGEGLAYLFAVYFIWGSTYLAIRVAVREGSGFPPFAMGAMRMLAASLLLFLWAVFRRQGMRPSRRDLGILAASGLLLWVGGNGLVVWAEQRAASGYAALLIGTTPIWAAVIESILDRRVPSRLLIAALLVGFLGIVVLSVPTLAQGSRASLLSLIALLFASIFWSLGSILQRRRPPQLTTVPTAAYQHLFGGIGFAVMVFLTQEPRPTPTPAAWLAWGYLVIIGSLGGFTSFLQALRLLPTNVVMTYAYVNPVVAVALGWLILREPITGWTIAGSALVLLGVAGVFRERYSRRRTQVSEGR